MNGQVILNKKMPSGITMMSIDAQTFYDGIYKVIISDGYTSDTSSLVIAH
jgi:hypothetical protein